MTDAFGAAQSTIDQSRLALLKAVQQAGTAGKAAYEAGQADLAAQRQQAVQSALAAAGGRGAPAELAGQISQTVAQPYDRTIGALRGASASREADLAARQANTDSYLSEVSAAIPVTRALAERQLAALRAKAAEKERKESEAAYDPLGIKAANKAFGGKENLTSYLRGAGEQIKDRAVATPTRSLLHGGGLSKMYRDSRVREARAAPVESLARKAGAAMGIDGTYLRGLVPDPKAPAPATPKVPSGFSPAEVEKLRAKDYYRTAASMAEELIGTTDPDDDSKPFSRQDFIAAVGRASFLKNKPRTRALIIAEYGGQFPGS